MSIGSLTESLRETLSLFDERCEPRGTNEVAELLDLGRRSTYDRLKRLVDHGCLETKKIGASARVWWRPRSEQSRPDKQTASSSIDGGTNGEPSDAELALVDEKAIPAEAVLDSAAVGVFVLDADFHVAWVNDAIERYFGLDRTDVLGNDKRELVEERIRHAVADSEAFAETVLATYEDNADSEEFVCRVTPGDGREERWLEHRSNPITSGPYEGGRVEVYYDVTEREQTAKQLTQEHERFQSFVEAVEEYAIFLLDSDGRVQTWNEGARRLKGYEREDILGEHFSTFYTDEDREAGVPTENLQRAGAEGTVEDEGWRMRSDGSRFWAYVTITAIYDDNGDLQGYTKVTRDMTERREREREIRAERTLLEQILETTPTGLGVFHSDGSVDRMNARMATLLGLSDEEEGYTLGDRVLMDSAGNPLETDEKPAYRVIETGDPVHDQEIRIDHPETGPRWYSVNAAPLTDESGDLQRVVTAAMDITQQKEQARRLERQRDELESELENVFERIDDAFYALDDEFRFIYANDRAEELLQHDAHELIGESIWEMFPEATETIVWDVFHRTLETHRSESFEIFYDPIDTWVEVHVYPSETGLSVYFRDISERKQYEETLTALYDSSRELLGAETAEAVGEVVVETVTDVLDISGVVTYFYDESEDRLYPGVQSAGPGFIREDLRPWEPGDSSITAHTFETGNARSFDDVSNSKYLQNEDTDMGAGVFIPMGEHGVLVVGSEQIGEFDERTRQLLELLAANAEAALDRVERTRALEESEQRYRILAENFPNGAVALLDEELRHTLVEGRVFENLDFDASDFRGERIQDVNPGEASDVVVPHYRAALEGESRTFELEFQGRTLEFRLLPLSDEDGDVSAVMAMSQDVTERKRRERELELQREQLHTLNNLNTIVRDITDAVIEQSTREEIEEIVCERLAASDSYEFAWFAEVDPRTQSIEPKVEVGVDGYLDEVDISVSPDEPIGRGPTGRAVQTGTIQVSKNVFEDPDFEPWRDIPEKYGYRSSAAIPVTHEGTIYGVIGVYTKRQPAFTDDEREVVGQIGEVVGHAIAAVERKRALMSDDVVELEFQIRDVFGALGLSAGVDGTVELNKAVPIGDDNFLQYGTATGDALSLVEELVVSDVLPHWESITVLEANDDVAHFELRLTEPPILSTVAAHSGDLREAKMEDGNFYMRIHLVPGSDVRQVVETIKDAYPAMEMITQRQITRKRQQSPTLRDVLFEDLTDRQRAALESAYYAGFYEWPRTTTGEEVAASLGVSPSTFHQHLRKGQRKLLAAALDEKSSV